MDGQSDLPYGSHSYFPAGFAVTFNDPAIGCQIIDGIAGADRARSRHVAHRQANTFAKPFNHWTLRRFRNCRMEDKRWNDICRLFIR